MPALSHFVGNVGGVRPEKQMPDVDANWHVAAMKDAQAIRDRAVLLYPCGAMYAYKLSVDRELTISVAIKRSEPQKTAAVRLRYRSIFKALGDGCAVSIVSAPAGASGRGGPPARLSFPNEATLSYRQLAKAGAANRSAVYTKSTNSTHYGEATAAQNIYVFERRPKDIAVSPRIDGGANGFPEWRGGHYAALRRAARLANTVTVTPAIFLSRATSTIFGQYADGMLSRYPHCRIKLSVITESSIAAAILTAPSKAWMTSRKVCMGRTLHFVRHSVNTKRNARFVTLSP